MLRYLPLAVLAFALLISACGGGGGDKPSPAGPASSPSPGAAADGSPEASPGSETPRADATPGADETPQPTEGTTASPVTMESVTSSVARGEEASVVAKTAPDTPCAIVITRTVYQDPDYVGTAQKFEVMKLDGLEPAISDASGRVSWDWQLAADTAAADWGVAVICGLGGATTSTTASLVVTEG